MSPNVLAASDDLANAALAWVEAQQKPDTSQLEIRRRFIRLQRTALMYAHVHRASMVRA